MADNLRGITLAAVDGCNLSRSVMPDGRADGAPHPAIGSTANSVGGSPFSHRACIVA
jgi:hypothetical protein